jgi:tetratricopeptide (TPR) repeat protein
MMLTQQVSPALVSAGRLLFGHFADDGFGRQRRLTRRAPDDSLAVTLLASSAARRGQLGRAGRLLCGSLASNPENQNMRMALSWVLFQRDQPVEALALIDEILAQDPDDFEAATRKAFVLEQLGHLDAAVETYDSLIARFPHNSGLLVARGRVLLALGRPDVAVADYRHALRANPSSGEAWSAMANVKTLSFSSDDIGRMLVLVGRHDVPPKTRAAVHFALGKAFEDGRSYGRSFTHYRQGNELQAIDAFPVREAVSQHVRQSMRFTTNKMMKAASTSASGLPVPIFVVGMPRSGSTLVEQILSCHHAVEGTAELPAVSAIAGSLGEILGRRHLEYADLLPSLSDRMLRDLGKRYLDQASVYRQTDRPHFIDKMPSNWMHLGLIRLMLPHALLVDVRRNALDCCFSNFAQHFPRGHEFTHRLEDLAAQYRDYELLTAHFDEIAPGALIRVSYEQLVARPEAVIRQLLADLDLPFDPACLQYFASGRPVRTPSAQQVRQRINRRGIDRWRPYAEWLGPLIEGLAVGREREPSN